MRGERLWGRPIVVWYLQAALLAADLLLLVGSRTVDGRIFAVMLVVAQLFLALYLYVGWIIPQLRAGEHERDDGFLPPR